MASLLFLKEWTLPSFRSSSASLIESKKYLVGLLSSKVKLIALVLTNCFRKPLITPLRLSPRSAAIFWASFQYPKRSFFHSHQS